MTRFRHFTSSIIFLASSLPLCAVTPATGKRAVALPDSLWHNAQWIAAPNAPVVSGRIKAGNERAADGASWFSGSITNSRKVVKGVWMTTGLGVYQLYVNGKPIGTEVLKPGFTHRDKTKRSFTYDITDALRTDAGDTNRLDVQSTPGWWGDKIITPAGHKGMYGGKVAFRGVLQLTFDDGSTRTFGTNPTDWKAGIAGPVKHAAIFDGEEYDARVQPGFDTPELLDTPEIHTGFNGEILPADGAEIYLRRDLELHPKEIYVWKGVSDRSFTRHGKVKIRRVYKPGEEILLRRGETLVVDFGQNCAAIPSFTFKANPGVTLTGLPGELLNDGNGARSRGMDGPEGSVHRLNLRVPNDGMRLKYTFGHNNGFTDYAPQCTFFGYRYLSLTADGDVTIKSVTSIPVSSITQEMETGTLSTGNESINQLISNTLWGQRSNYLSVPTDCPQRNERLGWTADTQVFAETGSFFADTRKFMHKWMRDMCDSRNEAGSFPGVAPTGQYGDDFSRVGWADAGVIVPWTIWKQYADTTIISQNWDAMERFMDRIDSTCYDHRALTADNRNFQWADWLSYEPLESCGQLIYARDPRGNILKDSSGNQIILPEAIDYWSYLGACYWLKDAAMMRDMARATGRDATRYDSMVTKARTYIRNRYLNDDGTFKTPIFNTMQTPALFALHCNLVEGTAKEKLIARLRNNFKEHGNCLQTGFLGTSILMPTLSDNGMTDLAYELLFQRNNPSWLYSVDNGATTIWERWNSYMLDKGMGPRGMNSFNHYAYGCVCEWMWKTMAGISADPSMPGFKRIIMRPQPDRRLGHVDARFDSAAGPITSNWRYEGNIWIWEFTIPEGATALVTLPGTDTTAEYTPGTHHITLPL